MNHAEWLLSQQKHGWSTSTGPTILEWMGKRLGELQVRIEFQGLEWCLGLDIQSVFLLGAKSRRRMSVLDR